MCLLVGFKLLRPLLLIGNKGKRVLGNAISLQPFPLSKVVLLIGMQ